MNTTGRKKGQWYVAVPPLCRAWTGLTPADYFGRSLVEQLPEDIKVGVINNPPSESGYREANVKDMEAVFSAENGYELKTFYSIKNDEQLQAAQGFITEGVD